MFFLQKYLATKVHLHLRIVLTSCQGIAGMELTGKRFWWVTAGSKYHAMQTSENSLNDVSSDP